MSIPGGAVRRPTAAPDSISKGAAGLVPLTFAVSAIILIAGTFVAVAAPFSHDEAVYLLMVEAAREGRLWISNGYELFPSESLKIRFLRDGPFGLVPQYPSGYGFLGLPFYLVGGTRGLMVMNASAHLLVMGIIYGLARRLDASRHVAVVAALLFGFGTFSIAYAVGIWPHAVAVAFVSGSVLAIVAAARADSERSWGLLLLAGLLVGLGMTIRVDVILLVPPVLMWLLAQPEHRTKSVLYMAGLVPGLLLASFLNFRKFGSWLPLDYGGTGGNTSLLMYWPLFPVTALALIAALALSTPRIRALCSEWNLVAGGVALLVAALALDWTRSILVQVAIGFYVLVVDFQVYRPHPWEAEMFSRTDHGHLLLVGQLKRSLVQSLPALGAFPLVFLASRREHRPVVLLFLLVISFWILPFALRSWHGGSVQNMRYFMPILPLACVLLALVFSWLLRQAAFSRRAAVGIVFAVALGTAMAAIPVFTGVHLREDWALGIATKGALGLAGTIATTMLLVIGLRGRLGWFAARLGLVLGVAALSWGGATSCGHDLLVSQAMRSLNATHSRTAAELEDGVLVVTGTAFRFMPQLMRPNSFVAVTGTSFGTGERGLIDFHLAQGRRVYIDGRVKEVVLSALGPPSFDTLTVPFERHGLVRLKTPR